MVLEGYLTGRRGTEAGTDWLTLEEEEALGKPRCGTQF